MPRGGLDQGQNGSQDTDVRGIVQTVRGGGEGVGVEDDSKTPRKRQKGFIA